MAKVKDPTLDGQQILHDPILIKEGIDVEKKGSAYQIRLKADGIKVIKHENVTIQNSKEMFSRMFQ